MIPTKILQRLAAVLALALLVLGGSSCSTYYDSYGYPQHAVDPGVAVAGAVAAGALGYALADSHHHRDYYHARPRRSYHRHRNYYRGHGHRRGRW